MNVRNRIMWETASIVKELKAREALPRILPLLAHEKQMVRYVTALHCLPIASAQAVPIIEAMAATHDPIESRHAARALERWRSESSRPM